MDWKDRRFCEYGEEGVFPGLGDNRERYTRIDQIQDHRADRVKRHTDHAPIEMPSSPRAADQIMLNTVVRSSDSVRGDRVSEQAPTRGSL